MRAARPGARTARRPIRMPLLQACGLGAGFGVHTRIVSSQEADANRPSGSTHSAATKPECPSRRAVSAPVLGSTAGWFCHRSPRRAARPGARTA
jgi:hypothetical protein